jgi:hypothetical protein
MAMLCLLVAGCFSRGDAPSGPADADPLPPSALTMSEARVSVSGDHRVGEFMVARDPGNPDHLVVAGYDFDSSQGPVFCNAYVTLDGAKTWQMVELRPGDNGGWGGDPWVTIAPNGDVHLLCLTVSTVAGASTVYHYTSADGGLAWGPPAILPGFTDKEAIFANRAGDLFACGSFALNGQSGLAVTRSTDGGATWGEATPFEGLNNCNGFVEGPAGQLHMVWLDVAAETRVVGTATSLDGGASWRAPTTVAAHPYSSEPTEPDPQSVGATTFTTPTDTWPSLAVSPVSGAVFLADGRDDLETGTSGIKLRVSGDDGATYALATLPAVPTTLSDVTFTRPTVTVDAQGVLGLQMVANGGPAYTEREVWFLASPDDGATWLAPVLVASTDTAHSHVDPRAHAPNTNSAASQAAYSIAHPEYPDTTFFIAAVWLANSGQLEWGGDYWGLTSTPGGFVALWEDFAEGGENRLYSRVVSVD